MIFRLLQWFLRKWGLVAIPLEGPVDYVPARVMEMMPQAVALVKEWDRVMQSGEFKRGRVYGRLIKKFPEARPRDVSWALERAVRQL